MHEFEPLIVVHLPLEAIIAELGDRRVLVGAPVGQVGPGASPQLTLRIDLPGDDRPLLDENVVGALRRQRNLLAFAFQFLLVRKCLLDVLYAFLIQTKHVLLPDHSLNL